MSTARRRLTDARTIAKQRARGVVARFQAHPWSPPVSSAFNFYNSTFDPIPVIHSYAVADLTPTWGYLTNFLGVKVDPKYYPPALTGRAGEIEGIPIPSNWHADIAEWGAALRAVDLARDSFTIVEVGCGWGCWLNNAGAAARSRGLELALCGIEADAEHLEFASESLTINGFSADQVHLHHGVAGAHHGTALFPRRGLNQADYGLQPIFDAQPDQVAAAKTDGTHDALEELTLADLTPGDRIDLLHIDIQGGEVDFVRTCLEQLRERVAYVLIGTHSREIEGQLCELMFDAGAWMLEIERPAIVELGEGRPTIRVDGVQGRRNLSLLPV
jgi:FkbM family methyltransferase